MTRTLTLAALAGIVASPAFATPEIYTIDGNHTFPRFSYVHFGFSRQLSRFNKTTGTVTLDAAAKTASVDVTIDMTSVDTGVALFDEHIQAPELLDTAAHPTATFKSTRVHFKGDTPVAIDGLLTLKGITKPVTLAVTSFTALPHPMLKKPAIGANASTVIRRSDFNAAKHVPRVSDEVTLDIALEAIRQ
jgi:polyisoprenoid-binding protein YceI